MNDCEKSDKVKGEKTAQGMIESRRLNKLISRAKRSYATVKYTRIKMEKVERQREV